MSCKYIKFESGGVLSVEMDANLFNLTARDRELYGAIVDLLLAWEKEHPKSEPLEPQTDHAEQE